MLLQLLYSIAALACTSLTSLLDAEAHFDACGSDVKSAGTDPSVFSFIVELALALPLALLGIACGAHQLSMSAF